jgi:hypothetical protein
VCPSSGRAGTSVRPTAAMSCAAWWRRSLASTSPPGGTVPTASHATTFIPPGPSRALFC